MEGVTTFHFFFIMAHKFLVALDRAHLRIYRFSQQPGQFTPSIQPVDALDVPEGGHSFFSSETDRASRLSHGATRFNSESFHEQPPLEDDQELRVVERLVERISDFFALNPHAPWHLAASSSLRDKVIKALPEAVRLRLDRVISKDLINVPPIELREHFVLR